MLVFTTLFCTNNTTLFPKQIMVWEQHYPVDNIPCNPTTFGVRITAVNRVVNKQFNLRESDLIDYCQTSQVMFGVCNVCVNSCSRAVDCLSLTIAWPSLESHLFLLLDYGPSTPKRLILSKMYWIQLYHCRNILEDGGSFMCSRLLTNFYWKVQLFGWL